MTSVRGVALAVALVLAALVVAGAVYTWPGDPWRVRITRTGAAATRPLTIALDYCRPSGSFRGAPVCEQVPTTFAVEGQALVADVPRSRRFGYREHALRVLPIEGVRVMLTDSSVSTDDGVATVAFTLGDTPDWADVGVVGMRELHVDVDDLPLVITTLTPRGLPIVAPPTPEPDFDPETEEPPPPRSDAEIVAELEAQMRVMQIRTAAGEFPRVRLCRGGHATLEFDIHPWPARQGDIEAVLVDGNLDRLIEDHYRDRSRPEHEVPLIVTRDEWRRLLSHDATRRGYQGGTPTLTLARGDHATTLWTAVGEGWDEPEFDEGFVLVGVLDPRSRSIGVGAVRVEVTRYRCSDP